MQRHELSYSRLEITTRKRSNRPHRDIKSQPPDLLAVKRYTQDLRAFTTLLTRSCPSCLYALKVLYMNGLLLVTSRRETHRIQGLVYLFTLQGSGQAPCGTLRENHRTKAWLEIMNYHIARYKMSIARYTMSKHREASPNPRRYDILSQMGKMFLNDGLSTLRYELVKSTQHHLYTHVLVIIDERS
ncbi:Beta-1,4-N-acetylgalactosaminyltransferase bre-4 [Eumeta japonica]|uniref:Beta-1,4-N-acetylgalactosaminyltransferase bre-4 n=1 Tax=Eumeta variegata TaxID=151549 RepID=A0A4C1ZLJ0_EUMVA|nr:Beta-1,4-N-acetylgalactosaminyltransferase bre-4 [Eumeta japonica]